MSEQLFENGYEFDFRFRQNNSSLFPHFLIAGVDEVGRGPLAGPVVSSAVILPSSPQIIGLNDSKMLSPQKREILVQEIKLNALSWTVSIVDSNRIDEINILQATLESMQQSIRDLKPVPHLVLIDGNRSPGSGLNEQAIVKGDTLSASIMAASILAKVTRDQIMLEANIQFPQYGFDQHKGYGSPQHLEALKKWGFCSLHRKSFEPVKSMTTQTVFISNPSDKERLWKKEEKKKVTVKD
ncbi:MAG: ribonuclease HII [Elusimicrobiota bacterium]